MNPGDLKSTHILLSSTTTIPLQSTLCSHHIGPLMSLEKSTTAWQRLQHQPAQLTQVSLSALLSALML
jgi:hypothetical protein